MQVHINHLSNSFLKDVEFKTLPSGPTKMGANFLGGVGHKLGSSLSSSIKCVTVHNIGWSNLESSRDDAEETLVTTLLKVLFRQRSRSLINKLSFLAL